MAFLEVKLSDLVTKKFSFKLIAMQSDSINLTRLIDFNINRFNHKFQLQSLGHSTKKRDLFTEEMRFATPKTLLD